MGNFWSYVDSFQNIQPVTTLLVLSMIAIFVYQCWKKVSAEEFAFRYELVVDSGQWWRCVTATFSHLSIFHIIMNMVSLWLMSYMESNLHSIPYLKYTLILILGTQACQIAAGWLLLRYKPERLGLTAGAGYSGVLFGWLMIYAMQDPRGSTSVFGLAIPNLVLPFVYLFATQLLIRRVSFIGHASGIIIGLIISLSAFRWFDHYLLFVALCWLPLLTLWNVKTTSDFPLAWLGLTSPAMPTMRVRDGQVIHASANNRDRDRDRERTGGRERGQQQHDTIYPVDVHMTRSSPLHTLSPIPALEIHPAVTQS